MVSYPWVRNQEYCKIYLTMRYQRPEEIDLNFQSASIANKIRILSAYSFLYPRDIKRITLMTMDVVDIVLANPDNREALECVYASSKVLKSLRDHLTQERADSQGNQQMYNIVLVQPRKPIIRRVVTVKNFSAICILTVNAIGVTDPTLKIVIFIIFVIFLLLIALWNE